MNRTVIIGAIVVVLAGVGYYQFVFLPQQEQAMQEEAAAAAAAAAEAEAAAAAEAAAEAVTEGAAAATEAVTEGVAAVAGAAAALDPANFNADAVIAVIDGSTLDDATKTTLRTAVEAARTNPALVADTVAQVRTALGL